LYLAGRLLELAQGWLYNYFIFLNDDISVDAGNFKYFCYSLKLWQPAIGLPSYKFNVQAKYTASYFTGDNTVLSLNRINLALIAYHREALEVLHPWYQFDITRDNPQVARKKIELFLY